MSTTAILTVPAIPSITIFVRHSDDCKYRDDESYKGCRCSKHFRYTHDGKQVRQSARTRFWKTAEDRRRQLEATFAADVAAVAIQPEGKATIEKAISLFIADKKAQGVSASVLKKYKRELGRLERFMSSRSKFLPHEIAVADLTEFRSDWSELYPSSQTRGKVQERLKAFLRYCYQARMIDRVPSLSAIKVDVAPTLPLTEAQYYKLASGHSARVRGRQSEAHTRISSTHAAYRSGRNGCGDIRTQRTKEDRQAPSGHVCMRKNRHARLCSHS